MIEKVKTLYKQWMIIHRKIPRTERFGIGLRIDNAFLDLMTSLRRAMFSRPERKIPLLEIALSKIDDIRFFTQLLWETKLISNEQLTAFGKGLESIGNDTGAWRKGVIAKTSATGAEGR